MSGLPRIGVDLHVFDGLFQGSRTYAIELFSKLIQNNPDLDFVLFLEHVEALAAEFPVFVAPHVQLVRMKSAHPVVRLLFQLPILQKRYNLTLLHNQYILPIPSLCPCVVTIHDVLFESHPQFFTLGFRTRSRLLMRLSATRAAHVVTDSTYSRNEIVNRYGIDPSKISVVYPGIDPTRFSPGIHDAEAVLRRGLTPGGYVLTTGRLEPRKNHIGLIDAYARLRDAPPLVIVGQRHFSFRRILEKIDDLGLNERIKILEDVSDSELPAIYRHALMFVFPSWAEGFGFPPLEAMASGVPVISSTGGSLLEIVGDGGLLVTPGNTGALVDAMEAVLRDARLRTSLSTRGLKQVGGFKWADTAAEVCRVYRRLFAGQHGTM